MAKKQEKPTHRLEDLEVNEVSVVDRGANLRRYLIVKNSEGNLTVQTEASMDTENNKSEQGVSLSELLFGGEDWKQFSAFNSEEDKSKEVVVIAKGMKAQLDEALKTILSRLTKVAGEVKGVQKDVPSALMNELTTIATAVESLADKLSKSSANAPTEQAKADFPSMVMQACELLMKITSDIKNMDPNTTEIPASMVASVAKVADMLKKAIEAAGGVKEESPEKPNGDSNAPEQEGDMEPQQQQKLLENMFGIEVMKSFEKTASGDPVVLIKSGQSIRKADLAKFRKAVEMLMAILEELESGPQEEASQAAKKAIDQGFADVSRLVKAELDPLLKKIEGLEKKQEEISSANPGSNGVDAEDTSSEILKNKTEKNIWTSVFN